MIGIEITFLAGRFHGNSWHRAHNEGVPEWPPSPWRVLRTLVSAGCAEDLTAADVEPLLEKLRGLPRYRLPAATEAHTRHYMPDTAEANHRRTKVFDTFVSVDGGARRPAPMTIVWPCELVEDEKALLSRLCRGITYLGRAESWADLRIVDVEGDQWDCWPDETGLGPATSLLAVADADVCGESPLPVSSGRIVRSLPRTLWEVLSFDGARFRAEGWSAVPGTRLARYRFADRPFRRVIGRSTARSRRPQPTVACFAIRSSVLPRTHDALAVAERLRLAAMSRSRDASGNAKPIFSGHDVVGNHGHARYLPLALDPANEERRALDHVLVVAEMGFEEEDMVALQGLRKIWTPGGSTLDLVLTRSGSLEDFSGFGSQRFPILARGRVWESVTPFVPTRHPKRVRGTIVDSIEEQIRRGCKQLRGVAPAEVVPFGEAAHWALFRRRRTTGRGRRGPDRAFGARLVFDQPIAGPLVIGYGSHFGLGLFRAVDQRRWSLHGTHEEVRR